MLETGKCEEVIMLQCMTQQRSQNYYHYLSLLSMATARYFVNYSVFMLYFHVLIATFDRPNG